MASRAIIFDFDGVLGQTMEDNYRAWAAALQTVGIPLEQEAYLLLEGVNVHQLALNFLTQHNLDPALAPHLAAEKERHYLEKGRFSFYPGVWELLESLHGCAPLGVVTGAGRQRLSHTLPERFFTLFQVVVTGDDVTHPKPHPEPYLRACTAVGVEPAQCVAVENAPLGIRSAQEAGMGCWAITSTLAAHHLQAADRIFPTLAAAGEALHHWLREG